MIFKVHFTLLDNNGCSRGGWSPLVSMETGRGGINVMATGP